MPGSQSSEPRDAVIEAIQGMLVEFQEAQASQPEPWLEVDLSIPQLRGLFLIEYLGTTRVGTLTQRLQLSPNATTALLDNLEERSLVQRTADPSDRRAVLVTVTADGTALIRNLRNANAERMGRRLARLSTRELSAFQVGMAGLLRAIQEERGDVAVSA
jgi:DNA-binding MarR family transcriptional regulator